MRLLRASAQLPAPQRPRACMPGSVFRARGSFGTAAPRPRRARRGRTAAAAVRRACCMRGRRLGTASEALATPLIPHPKPCRRAARLAQRGVQAEVRRARLHHLLELRAALRAEAAVLAVLLQAVLHARAACAPTLPQLPPRSPACASGKGRPGVGAPPSRPAPAALALGAREWPGRRAGGGRGAAERRGRTVLHVRAEAVLVAVALAEQAVREAQVVCVLDLLPEQLLLALAAHAHGLVAQAVLHAALARVDVRAQLLRVRLARDVQVGVHAEVLGRLRAPCPA